MKTLVLGLGNPILSDDGVGLRVAAGLKAVVDQPDISIVQTELGGLNLLELLVGYDRAIIIDAIQTHKGKPGHIHRLTPDSLQGTRHTDSTHGIDFASIIELGKRLGLAMPREILIFAIEAKDVYSFGEDCSPEVKEAIPVCIDQIVQIIKDNPIT